MPAHSTRMDPPRGLARIRRNHALEHATIHLLSRRHPNRLLIGRSDRRGFFLIGDVSTDDVRSAAEEALQRLRRGEIHLAIHPNCGTNLLAAGGLAGIATYLTLARGPDRQHGMSLARLPLAVLAATLAVLVSQPLGLAIQRNLTTDGSPSGLTILRVEGWGSGRATVHRVLTQG